MKKVAFLGWGIVQGMVVTGMNWVRSYFDAKRLITVEYPEQKMPLPENSRNFPFLVFDGDNAEANLRCTSCKTCEKECPPKCIRIVTAKDEKGKPLKHPQVFDIDISTCMSCQICVEVCPFDAIKMDSIYEYAATSRFGALVLTKRELAKSNEYYRSIKATEAAEVDGRLEADRKKKEEASKKKAAANVGG